MEKICMTPEQLEELINNVAEKSASKVEETIIELFGFENEDEAKKLMRYMGESAKSSAEFMNALVDNAKAGLWSAFKQLVKIAVFFLIGYVAYHFGLTGLADKFLK